MLSQTIIIIILITFSYENESVSAKQIFARSLDSPKANQKKYVIIDTDAGVDDAFGLMLAFDYHKRGLIQIVAITCSYGNAYVDQVVRNVLLTQRAAKAMRIKVYRGVENPLLEREGYQDGFYGTDGLGNATYSLPQIEIKIEKEHAVLAMIRLAKKYHDITLITLGPLTNLAMAIQLDPSFTSNLAQIVSMGGLLDMVGNVGPTTEFNFYTDPEAVDLVLKKSVCPLAIVPFDTAINYAFPLDQFEEITSYDTERAEFIAKIHELIIRRAPGRDLVEADILAVITGIVPDLVTQTVDFPVAMELNGKLTRGQLVVNRSPSLKNRFPSSRNVTFIVKIDLQKSIELISQILQN